MKKSSLQFMIILTFLFSVTASSAWAVQAVTITQPAYGATVSSPVTFCMDTWGVEVQAAKKGVNEGRGHHHLLIDVELPSDLSQPVAKDASHVHMGDGSRCKTLELSPGKHTIRSLFARGNHVPYDPPLTDVIEINVK